MLIYELVIPRGAVFLPKGWVLKSGGNPIRSEDGLDVVAKIRRHSGDREVLLDLDVSVVMMALPEQYGADSVAVAMLAGIPREETAQLEFDRGVWDLMVNYEPPMVGGPVSAPWVVSR